MDLKERFEHYEQHPDDAVWQRVNKTLRRRKIYRYVGMFAAVALLAGIAAVAYWPQEKQPVVAENTAAIGADSPNTARQGAYAKDTLQPVQRSSSNAVRSEAQAVATRAASACQEESKACPATLPVKVARVENSGNGNGCVNSPMPATRPAPTPMQVQDRQQEKTGKDIAVATTKQQAKTAKVTSVTRNDSLMVWIPNAFSPQDPGNAEVRQFRVRAKEGAEIHNFKMYVYNRAGAQVFRSTSMDDAWDGTYRGEACPMGAYVYIIEYKDAARGIQHTRGTVTLLR